MNADTEKRAIAFINTIADRCSRCLRRSQETCPNCESAWAQSIMADLSVAHVKAPDYSLAARMKLVRNQLESAGRPLLASEIDLKGLCTHQLKLWTLKRMVRMGILRRKVAVRKQNSAYRRYRYYLPSTKETSK